MILVSGSTGRVGSALVRELRAAGAPFRALVRSEAKGRALREQGVEVAVGDLDDARALDAALDGADHFFLLSPGAPDLADVQSAALETARETGVEHIVKLSALGSTPDGPSRFGRLHAEVEEKVAASGVGYTFLRPGSFMQNLLFQADSIGATGTLFAPLEDARVAVVHADDIGAVAARALTEPGYAGRALDITGPEALSWADLAAKLSEATGREIAYVDVPPDRMRASMLEAGSPEWQTDGLLELYTIYRAGYAAAISPTVEEVTGRPARSFELFAREHRDAFAAAG